MKKKVLQILSFTSDIITIVGYAISLVATNNNNMTLHYFFNWWFIALIISLIITISVYAYYYIIETNDKFNRITDYNNDLKRQIEILDIRCTLYDILYNKYRSKNASSPYLLSPTDLSIVKSNHNEEYLNIVAQYLDDLFILQKGIKNKDKEEYL